MEPKGGGNRVDAPRAGRANVNSVWLIAFFFVKDMWQILLWRTGAVRLTYQVLRVRGRSCS